jgi:hypothetical protein
LSLTGFVEAEEVVLELLAFTHHQGRWAKYGHDIAYVSHDGVSACRVRETVSIFVPVKGRRVILNVIDQTQNLSSD